MSRVAFINQNVGENGGMGGSGELGCEGESNLPLFLKFFFFSFSVLGGQESGFGERQILSCFFFFSFHIPPCSTKKIYIKKNVNPIYF